MKGGPATSSRSLSYAVATFRFRRSLGFVIQQISVHPKILGTIMEQTKVQGIVRLPSNHAVNETVERLRGVLQAKGVALFALVDHSGEAEKVGLRMPNTKLLIFGSPRAGTPVMQAAPSAALDLPLKILVAEDLQGKVWISYNSPHYLQQRHGFSSELLQNIAAVEFLAAKAGE